MATCGAGLEMAAKQLGECLKGVSDILNSNSTCVIDEESDGYGFSLIGGGRYADTDVIQSFREDANWNNPGAVGLMKRAFGITDEHDSVLLRREPIGDSFIVLRKQYNTMLAHKFFVDGKLLKDKGSLVDSCKRFDEAIRLDSADPEIFIERASVKTILGKSEDALRDYESAIQLDPANAAAQSEAHALRLSIRQTIPAVAAKATASSANIVHTPASSSSSIANAPSATNRSLIDKLQQ
jgi:tetratricopeptide (TPR) repeat protein